MCLNVWTDKWIDAISFVYYRKLFFRLKAMCTRMPRVRHTHTLFLSLYNLLRLSVFMCWCRLHCILEPDTSESTLQSFLEEQTIEKRHTCESVSPWEDQDAAPEGIPGNLWVVWGRHRLRSPFYTKVLNKTFFFFNCFLDEIKDL